MFKHIFVPIDGSSLSQDALRRAVSFAKEAEAKITLFYAKPEYHVSHHSTESARLSAIMSTDYFEELAENQAQEILDPAMKLCKEAGVSCQKMTLTSDLPHEGIIDGAKGCGCDLIFMASHGRRGISALLLGSETQKVLTHSTIPVLVHRSAEAS